MNKLKQITILRGVPGSGKTTWVAANREPDSVICSADHHFTRSDGSYHFDGAQLGAAHSACLSLFESAVRRGASSIFVDNCSISSAAVRTYVDALRKLLGPEAPYCVRVVRLVCDAETAFARQTHGVGFKKIKTLVAQLEREPPIYLNGICSEKLIKVQEEYE